MNRVVKCRQEGENSRLQNYRHVLNVVCFLLGNSPASKFYMPMVRDTVCSIFIGRWVFFIPTCLQRWNGTECSKTSEYKTQMPGNYPEKAYEAKAIHMAQCSPNVSIQNPTASARFEPANLGTKGQHATPRCLQRWNGTDRVL